MIYKNTRHTIATFVCRVIEFPLVGGSARRGPGRRRGGGRRSRKAVNYADEDSEDEGNFY